MNSTISRRRLDTTILVAILVAANLPQFSKMYWAFWSQPCYRFFSLAVLGAIVLVDRAFREAKEAGKTPDLDGNTMIVLAWGGVALTMVSGRPMVWGICAVAVAAAAVLVAGRLPLLCKCVSSLFLLCLGIPIPTELVSQVMAGVQISVAWGAGKILDLLSVIHEQSGIFVEVADHKWIVDEPSSGVDWLLVSGVVGILVVLWNRCSILRALLFVVATVGWAWVACVARIAFAVVMTQRQGRDPTADWPLVALGPIVIAFTLLLIVSTYRLLFPPADLSEPSPSLRGRMMMRICGLLVLLGGIVVAAVFIFVPLLQHNSLKARYESAAEQSLARGDFRRARLCYSRLARTQPNPKVVFALAHCWQALGDTAQASTLVNQIAEPGRQGYPPAHLWQARTLLAGGPISSSAGDLAEAHLRDALKGDPQLVDADALLGELLFAKGRLSEAEPHVVRAVTERPELGMSLARLFAQQHKAESARHQGLKAAEFFVQRTKDKAAEPGAYLSLAEIQVFLEDFPAAEAVLKDAISHVRDTRLDRALAQVYVAWFDWKGRESQPSVQERVELLRRALHYDIHDATALERMLDLSRTGDLGGDPPDQQHDSPLGADANPALVELWLGIKSHNAGNIVAARKHWQECYRQDHLMAFAANNLAFLLASKETSDSPLALALALVNSALEQFPSHPRMRETRGRIFAKMERWKEALFDLEAALPALPDNGQTMAIVITACQRLGLNELAAAYQNLAPKNRR